MNMKKALKHDVEVAGKTIPTMILIGLFLVGGGSAALLSSFGTVSGDADVTQAVLVNGQNDKTNPSDLVSSSDGHVAGTYFVSDLNSDDSKTMTIASQTESPVTVELDTEYAEGSSPSSYSDSFEGVTAHNIVYDTPDYDPKEDIVVDADDSNAENHYSTIQDAVDAADGDTVETVYVEAGDYNGFEPVDGTEVVSVAGPEETSINLQDTTIDITGGDLTVKGFRITGTGEEGSEGKEGAIAHWTPGNNEGGELVVEDNIFDGQFAYRAAWSQNAETTTIEGNFFTGSSDAGFELTANDGGSDTVTASVEGNTFAGLADKGVALRAKDGYTDSITIRNNNFVSNSNSAIQAGWSGIQEGKKDPYDHATFTAEDNYFDHTGDKIQDNTETSDVDSDLLNSAEEPYSGGEVTLSAGESVEVTQLTYLDIALGGDDSYGLKTSVNPVR